MSIGLDTAYTRIIHSRTIPAVLPQAKLYLEEDAYTLFFKTGDKDKSILKNIAIRCKAMPNMCIIKDNPGVLSDKSLDESFIIRSPHNQKKPNPINIYNLGGNKIAYIGDSCGSNWGDSVILPRDGLIDTYTDLICDCPLLIMLLVGANGKESRLLTHVHGERIDSEVANITSVLKLKKSLSPKEIIFSLRSDSIHNSALHDLRSFGRNVRVEVIERAGDSMQALVTSDGWCISDSTPFPASSTLIAGRLWKRDV